MDSQDYSKENKWKCQCGGSINLTKTKLVYLGGQFQIDLLKCDRCGQVLVPEELATGRMLAVEKMFEDK